MPPRQSLQIEMSDLSDLSEKKTVIVVEMGIDIEIERKDTEMIGTTVIPDPPSRTIIARRPSTKGQDRVIVKKVEGW